MQSTFAANLCHATSEICPPIDFIGTLTLFSVGNQQLEFIELALKEKVDDYF